MDREVLVNAIVARSFSIPAALTLCREKPFGENVEGLSNFRDKSYTVEAAVQKHDFEQTTFCHIVGGKPLLP